MSGSEPIWADQSRGGGWWSSPSGVSTRPAPGRRRTTATAGLFRTRLAFVEALHNDGSLARAKEIAAWVLSTGGRETAYVEQLPLGNWGVVVLRPERPDPLWVLTDHHRVLDPRRRPQ